MATALHRSGILLISPLLLTVEGDTQAGDAFVMNATAREEEAADQACHIAVSPKGCICGLFRGRSSAITPFALQVGGAGLFTWSLIEGRGIPVLQ